MSQISKQIRFPPMRFVQGNMYKAQDKDFTTGQPRVYPAGHAKAGQPKISWFFAGAVPKQQGEAAWWDTSWGKEIVPLAQQMWPRGEWQTPTFAWKIEDGDSQIPNKKGRKNANTEGFAGCWIVNFSSGFAPKICDVNGQPILETDVVKLGYWIEVASTVRSNETQGNPGIYINHDFVCFRGRDKEIFVGVDPSTLGFGKAAVPAHVSMAPVGSALMPSTVGQPTAPVGTPMIPGAPAGMPSVPAMPMAPNAGVYVPPGAPAAAPVSVQPHPGFIQPGAPGVAATPVVPAAPQMPGAPVVGGSAPPAPVAAYQCPAGAPAGHRMVNPSGPRYDAYRGQGWSDAQLIGNGLMVKL